MINHYVKNKVQNTENNAKIHPGFRAEKQYRKFEIKCLSCSLTVNDPVMPGTIAGADYHTRKEIKAPFLGKIATGIVLEMADGRMNNLELS